MIELNIAQFREQFPAFSDPVKYPDATLEFVYSTATCYISDSSSSRMTDECRIRAIYLMLAHLLKQSDDIARGHGTDFVISATKGPITTTVQPPPATNQWEWWLNTTEYGQQLLALLSVSLVGGFMIGGSPELAGFRKAGGVF